MRAGQPSRTARFAAAHRAAHQILERGRIFSDPLAVPILGQTAEALASDATDNPARRPMRLFIAARTRFAEDALAREVERGVRQLVVVGAGLDTFAYRNPHAGLRVFEVDHPATQAWKRRRLADAGIALPASLRFAPVDFEHETLVQALTRAGFDTGRPAFFSCLGVVPYLSQGAILETLAAIGTLPRGTRVVFDYSGPPSSRWPESRIAHQARAARVAELGEPWISFFEPGALAAKLRSLGFSEIQDLGPPEIARRYFPSRDDPHSDRGGHFILAGIG